MAKVKVEASLPKEDKSAVIEYDFGENVDEAVEKFGEEIVFAHFKGSAVIALQGRMRSLLKAGKNVVEELKEWKPGIRTPGKSKVEKADELLAGLSEEEKAALLAKYGPKKNK